jgi:DNA-directed RNA polymerase I, II, and III subunit RPABC2
MSDDGSDGDDELNLDLDVQEPQDDAVSAVDEGDVEENADEEEEDMGLDEGAAGTSSEESSSDDDANDADDADDHDPVPPHLRAVPTKSRVDPILRASNRSVTSRIVPAEERKTSNYLQKGEAALLLATRAEQIARSGTCFVDTEGITDAGGLAYKELMERRTPLTLRRYVGTLNGDPYYEEWSPREMTLPALPPPNGCQKPVRQ